MENCLTVSSSIVNIAEGSLSTPGALELTCQRAPLPVAGLARTRVDPSDPDRLVDAHRSQAGEKHLATNPWTPRQR